MKNAFLAMITTVLFQIALSQKTDTSALNNLSRVSASSVLNWLNYEQEYVKWSEDFIALDTLDNKISKEEFLLELTTGRFLPILIHKTDSSLTYRLLLINESTNTEVISTIRNKAITEYSFFKMEGNPLPGFNFTDLEGTVYNKENMRGKFLVIKCWFINCVPCVAEMPNLNKMVSELESENIVFLSLAFDNSSLLNKFLKKKQFNYKVVPDQYDYLINTLKIKGYPTHLLIGKNGSIVKASNNYLDIKRALLKQLLN